MKGKKMKLKKLRITRAKRTAMGRFVCRLLGDECGAVAMEYVVIALLVVAAAVGAAVYFGRAISGGFKGGGDMITDVGTKVETRSGNVKKEMGDIKKKGAETTKAVQTNMTGGGIKNE